MDADDSNIATCFTMEPVLLLPPGHLPLRVPNFVAGGLAAASSRVVSIIIPSIRNAFFAETVSVLQAILGDEGYQLLVGHSEYSDAQEEALVRAALAWAPAAIVLTGFTHSAATRELLRKSGIPVMEMWELDGHPIDMAVGFSHRDVGATTARHLLDKGHRRLAFLGARLHEDRRAAQRAAGFTTFVEQFGGATAALFDNPAPASTEAGSLLLSRALRQIPDLRAVACSNDLIALGALFECQRRGLAVPQELAVIGFGDLGFAANCVPPLTTIRPSGDIIGKEVARLVLARIRDETDAGWTPVVDIGHLLVQRSST